METGENSEFNIQNSELRNPAAQDDFKSETREEHHHHHEHHHEHGEHHHSSEHHHHHSSSSSHHHHHESSPGDGRDTKRTKQKIQAAYTQLPFSNLFRNGWKSKWKAEEHRVSSNAARPDSLKSSIRAIRRLQFSKSSSKVARNMPKVIALALCVAGLIGCWSIGKSYESRHASLTPNIPNAAEEMETDFPYLALTQLDTVTGVENAALMDLNNLSGTVEITEEGDYLLQGELHGNLHIQCKEQHIRLILNNASILSPSGPAIFCEEAEKLVITLAPGSDNVISDSGDYRESPDEDACIYSDCDLTFNGTGSLTVNGFHKDAVRSMDVLKIVNGTYTIKCKRTGLQGNDGLFVNDGNIMISSEKYGMKTTKRGAEGRGNLMVGGGEISIIAGRFAFVVSKANLYIYNCTVYNRSIVNTFDVAGLKYVENGCMK